MGPGPSTCGRWEWLSVDIASRRGGGYSFYNLGPAVVLIGEGHKTPVGPVGHVGLARQRGALAQFHVLVTGCCAVQVLHWLGTFCVVVQRWREGPGMQQAAARWLVSQARGPALSFVASLPPRPYFARGRSEGQPALPRSRLECVVAWQG